MTAPIDADLRRNIAFASTLRCDRKGGSTASTRSIGRKILRRREKRRRQKKVSQAATSRGPKMREICMIRNLRGVEMAVESGVKPGSNGREMGVNRLMLGTLHPVATCYWDEHESPHSEPRHDAGTSSGLHWPRELTDTKDAHPLR